MRILLYLAIGAAVTGAALAQETPPVAAGFRPHFETRPDAPGRVLYPVQSLVSGVPGSVLLCCSPRPDRTLSCRVAVEIPNRRGFGDAARSMVQDRQQLTAESYAEYLAAAPGEFSVPMHFNVTGHAPAPALPSDSAAPCNQAPGG